MNKPKANVLSKSVFIHMPKTGGTWIREHFNEQGWWKQLGVGHVAPDQLSEEDAALPRFAFVRHPVTWLMSWWAFTAFRLEHGFIHTSRILYIRKAVELEGGTSVPPWPSLVGLWSPSLNDYIRSVIKYRPSLPSESAQRYTHGCLVGRQEHLVKDLCEMLETVGEPVSLDLIRSWDDKRNATSKYGQSVKPALAEVVVDLNPWLKKHFGYSYDYEQEER